MSYSAATRRAVFLDRDGVLNATRLVGGAQRPPASVRELQLLPDVAEACARLSDAGLLLIVVTNQPDIARRQTTSTSVAQINAELLRALPIDAVFICPHDEGDGCECRKPRPGMLLRAARQFDIDLSRSVMVGDRWRDIEAGRAAQCATVFVDHGAAEPQVERPDAVVGGLAEAVPYILRVTETVAQAPQHRGVDARSLRVHIFADGADRAGIAELARSPLVKGFTTNPTLMRAAGIADYEGFARDVIATVPDRPVSFEVLADDLCEMERQARRVASWGDNVYVKVPVTDTTGHPTTALLRRLASDGVKVNVTAVFTPEQVRCAAAALAGATPCFISVFAGRIADTGRDPLPILRDCLEVIAPVDNLRLIWASPREVLNVIQADEIGCHVITVTHELLSKLTSFGKGLEEFSLETVRMFRRDAQLAGFTL